MCRIKSIEHTYNSVILYIYIEIIAHDVELCHMVLVAFNCILCVFLVKEKPNSINGKLTVVVLYRALHSLANAWLSFAKVFGLEEIWQCASWRVWSRI